MLGHIWTEEQRLKMSNSRKNKYCGDNHYFSKMNAEERKKFIKEHSSFTDPWWNNGTIQRRCKTAPGPEWKRGMIKTGHNGDSVIGIKWYNNGIISVRTKICPDGFKPGRLKKY